MLQLNFFFISRTKKLYSNLHKIWRQTYTHNPISSVSNDCLRDKKPVKDATKKIGQEKKEKRIIVYHCISLLCYEKFSEKKFR